MCVCVRACLKDEEKNSQGATFERWRGGVEMNERSRNKKKPKKKRHTGSQEREEDERSLEAVSCYKYIAGEKQIYRYLSVSIDAVRNVPQNAVRRRGDDGD